MFHQSKLRRIWVSAFVYSFTSGLLTPYFRAAASGDYSRIVPFLTQVYYSMIGAVLFATLSCLFIAIYRLIKNGQ